MYLPVIDGHAVFPDFRIEYEDERGDIGRVDVEVASDNYHDHHIATKLAAGFRVYGSASAVKRFGISETVTMKQMKNRKTCSPRRWMMRRPKPKRNACTMMRWRK